MDIIGVIAIQLLIGLFIAIVPAMLVGGAIAIMNVFSAVVLMLTAATTRHSENTQAPLDGSASAHAIQRDLLEKKPLISAFGSIMLAAAVSPTGWRDVLGKIASKLFG